MGRKIVQVDMYKKILTVDCTLYDFTPGLHALVMRKKTYPSQWTTCDYPAYKSLCAQTNVLLFPEVLLEHTLHGNTSKCLGKWLCL